MSVAIHLDFDVAPLYSDTSLFIESAVQRIPLNNLQESSRTTIHNFLLITYYPVLRDEPAWGATGGLGLCRGHGDGHQQHVLHHVQVRKVHFKQPVLSIL